MITGAIVGAGAMYFLDPRLGNRRRALVLDQMHRLSRRTSEGLDTAFRDLQNRAVGTAAELQGLTQSHDAPDDVIAQRVRSRLGRLVSHPASIEVDVSDGHVCLSGPILRDEAQPLVSAMRWVRGVRSVHDDLDVRDDAGDEPALQGSGCGEECPQGWAGNWAPATRLLATGLGGAMLLNCVLRRSLGGLAGGFVGTGLLVRALSNRNLGEAIGVSAEGRAIDVRKTITIDAPIEEVFAFFAEPKNLERISDIITQVETRPGGGFTKHMLIGGVPVRMDERFVRKEPPEILETHSEGSSPFEYTKEICFEQSGGGTRVDVLFSYLPPGGVLAHAAAGALGFDPKTLLGDLLMRAKSTLETGRLPHDAQKSSPGQRTPTSQQRPASPVQGTRTETLSGAVGTGAAWPQPSGQVPPAV
jgi:uncharacterized membrane protein